MFAEGEVVAELGLLGVRSTSDAPSLDYSRATSDSAEAYLICHLRRLSGVRACPGRRLRRRHRRRTDPRVVDVTRHHQSG
jgi:hypothetical protein